MQTENEIWVSGASPLVNHELRQSGPSPWKMPINIAVKLCWSSNFIGVLRINLFPPTRIDSAFKVSPIIWVHRRFTPSNHSDQRNPSGAFNPQHASRFPGSHGRRTARVGTFWWKDLALDQLLPVDKEKETALKAAEARKMASRTHNQNPQTQQQPAALAPGDETIDEEDDEDEDDENDDDENDDEADEDEDSKEDADG
ncbi:hypothetical protein GG344DRAFT_83514 [Lentinula edodes]|nr:hypothetical protein GG344DRAFT_83514 [Lentinula edodes]